MLSLVVLTALFVNPTDVTEVQAQSNQIQVPAIMVIEKAGNALEAVGKGIGALADGLKKAVSNSYQGWTVVEARQAQASLLRLSQFVSSVSVANVPAGSAIALYLNNPTPASWAKVRRQLVTVIVAADTALRTLRADSGKFALEPAYIDLQTSLTERIQLLTRLQELPPPSSEQELAALRKAHQRYAAMIADLRAAGEQLASFVKEVERRNSNSQHP